MRFAMIHAGGTPMPAPDFLSAAQPFRRVSTPRCTAIRDVASGGLAATAERLDTTGIWHVPHRRTRDPTAGTHDRRSAKANAAP